MGKKVLMFGWEFPPHHSGGLGVACQGLTKAMAEEGMQVKFVLPKRVPISSDWVDFVFPKDGPTEGYVRRKEIASMMFAYADKKSYKEYLNKFGYSGDFADNLIEEVYRYGKCAEDIAREEDFDVIHAHDWLTFPAAVSAQRVSGKPLVVHVHATEFNRGGGVGIHQEIYDIEREGMHAANKVVAVSQFMKDLIVEKYDVPEEKVEVVHNGIDSDVFGYKELPPYLEQLKEGGNFVVSYLGRITIQKGIEYFFEAAHKVLQIRDNVYFVVTGSGDLEDKLKRRAEELGIADKVIFTGWLKRDMTLRMLQSTDLLVMPSVSEPFGLVGLEALLNKTPVLLSKQSGLSEVLKHAMKVDFWDTNEMANKIVSVIDHPNLQKMLTEEGNKEALDVTWNKAAQKILGVYTMLSGVKTV